MAGGTDAGKLPAALQSVQGWVAERDLRALKSAMTDADAVDVLVMGAGTIGCFLGGSLAAAGVRGRSSSAGRACSRRSRGTG